MARTIIAVRSADGNVSSRIRCLSDGPLDAVLSRVVGIRSGTFDADCVMFTDWADKHAAKLGIAEIAKSDTVRFAAEIQTRTYSVCGNLTNGPIPEDAYKVMLAYRLPDNRNPDDFWHYHTEIHGPEVVAAAGKLLVGYALSRRISTLAGDAGFFALIELWWTNESAAAAYVKQSASYVTQSGKAPLDDWASHNLILDFSVELIEMAT